MRRLSMTAVSPGSGRDYARYLVWFVVWSALSAAAVFALVGLTEGVTALTVWSAALGLTVTGVGITQLAVRRPNPPALLSVAAVFVGASAWLDVGNTAAMAVALVMASVAAGVMVRRPRVRIAYISWIVVMAGSALKDHMVASSTIVAVVAMAAGLVATIVIMDMAGRVVRRDQAQYRQLLVDASDAVVMVDSDLRITLFNRRAEEMFGYREAEMLGEPLARLLPERFRSRHEAHIRGFAAGHEDRRPMGSDLDLYGLKSDGRQFPVEIAISRIDIDGDRVFMAVVRDVSRRRSFEKRIREADVAYADLFKRVPVGLYRTMVDGEILVANRALAELIGFESPEDLRGRNAEEFYADSGARAKAMRTTGGRLRSVAEFRLRRRDGSVIWVRDRRRVVRDRQHRIRFFEGELVDITAEKAAIEELESQLRWRIDFLASISHEVNTPLTGVVGFIDLAIEEARPGGGEVLEYLRTAAGNAEHLGYVVEDLLTVALLDGTDVDTVEGPTLVRKSVEDAVHALRLNPVAATVRNDVQFDLRVACDERRLTQILRNVIGNAIRHGSPPFVVSSRPSPGASGEVEIVVSDKGPGIPHEMVSEVFKRFSSAEARAPGAARPLGLGLSLSRDLARSVGGGLSYRRYLDETQLILTLPRVA